MNFKKYSKQLFESHGLNTPAARRLADELQDDVSREIHIAVLEEFRKIIDALNAQGHQLEVDGEIKIGDLPFRDESNAGQCGLRLACDVVISAGYSDTAD
jgi:hypothetical protein